MNSRYSRQIAIPEIGKEGQSRIQNAKVFVIGCGALGSMVAMQLAGAGIGCIGIADFDTVDISNLQRQFFFGNEDAGKSKAEVLAFRIKELNPETKVVSFEEMMIRNKALEIFKDYDFIVDGTDNPESKRMTGNVCQILKKACTIGGVREFSGQVMTFLSEDPRLEEFFGSGVGEGFLPCSLSGVLGPAAVFCASVLASETLKYITGAGNLLSGKIFVFDLKTNSFRVIEL